MFNRSYLIQKGGELFPFQARVRINIRSESIYEQLMKAIVIVIVMVKVIGKNRWRVRINIRSESIYEQMGPDSL